ncbi:MAG: PASTA domain-containing protein [Clostridia bacterium]|nr:PASTA domain-containing protein [Clostridia bacterium]
MNASKTYCMNCFTAMDALADKCPRCGWSDAGQVRNALPFGTVLRDKYLIGQATRINGAGISYAALERKTNEKVEIREFFPTSIAFRESNGVGVHSAPGAELKYSDYLSEFERYIQKLIGVSGIKRIPAVLDSFSENQTQYVVFRFVESIPLRSYVEQNGPMPWETCAQYFLPVIESLSELHARGVDHLGISPDTLRITEDGKMILTEFEMHSVRRAGTDLMEDIYPGCWAIEQYSRTKICDEVTDVYGLCASLLFALTGTVPMEAPKRKQDPRLMISRSILRTLPEPVVPAIANAMQVDADRRTFSFSRFAAELTAEPTVMETVVETKTLRSLPTASTRNPRIKTLPPFAWLILSFALSLGMICLITGVWFKDSAFSPQSIMSAFEEPEVSAVSQTIKLPNLVGMDYDEVLELTKSSGEYAFTLRIYEESFDENVPAGQITDQLPFAQSMIKAGDTVKVAVSRGSAKRILPEITGLSAEQATELLKSEGFVPVQVPTVQEGYAYDTVIGYRYGGAGDNVAHGAVVQFLVSVDPEVEPTE